MITMEDTILEIIDKLDSRRLDDIVQGIIKLEQVLSLLLPYIASSRKSPHTPRNTKLVTFINLQDNFQYNIASHLIQYYKLIWDDLKNVDMNIILTCNRLLQGLLLLHPGSRKIFNRPNNMNTMLNFLGITNIEDNDLHLPIEITISFISMLIHILLKDLVNFRVFEENKGCSIIIRKLQLSSFSPHKESQPSKQQELNFKIIEFLIFYLIDENEIQSATQRRTTKEKSELFRSDFAEIDSLVESLNDLKNL